MMTVATIYGNNPEMLKLFLKSDTFAILALYMRCGYLHSMMEQNFT